jgi:hypothetical protein
MKNKDPEVLVAYINSTFLLKLVIYAAAIFGYGLLVMPNVTESTAKVATLGLLWLSCSGAVAAVQILFTGIRMPGYQAALTAFSTDKAEKARMRAKYNAIKTTKPCNLSMKQVLISAGAGFVIAAVLASML